MQKLLGAALLVLLAFAANAADKSWTRFDGCRYLPDKNNDGDSFLVQCGREKFYARFYFVDAPESNASLPERVREQYEYWGVTMDQLTRAGSQADAFIRKSLSTRPFTLYTKRASAQGRAKTERYYSLIHVDGRYLHEAMLSEGLARTKGTTTTLPTGEKSRDYVKGLRTLESRAQLERRGIWRDSLESRRKSPL